MLSSITLDDYFFCILIFVAFHPFVRLLDKNFPRKKVAPIQMNKTTITRWKCVSISGHFQTKRFRR